MPNTHKLICVSPSSRTFDIGPVQPFHTRTLAFSTRRSIRLPHSADARLFLLGYGFTRYIPLNSFDFTAYSGDFHLSAHHSAQVRRFHFENSDPLALSPLLRPPGTSRPGSQSRPYESGQRLAKFEEKGGMNHINKYSTPGWFWILTTSQLIFILTCAASLTCNSWVKILRCGAISQASSCAPLDPHPKCILSPFVRPAAPLRSHPTGRPRPLNWRSPQISVIHALNGMHRRQMALVNTVH